MKKLILFILLAASASSSLLQKVEGDVINEDEYNNQASLLEKDSTPICHLLSSISYLGIKPKLMMDPLTLGKGAKTLGKELGLVEERCVSGKTPVVTSAIVSSFIGSSSSSASSASSLSSGQREQEETKMKANITFRSSFLSSTSVAETLGESHCYKRPLTEDQEAPSKKQKIDDSTSSFDLKAYCQNFLIPKENEEVESFSEKKLDLSNLFDYKTIEESDCVNEGLEWSRWTDHENIKRYRNEVLEAYQLEDYSLAMSWIQVVENLQQAIKESLKARKYYSNNNLSSLWKRVANEAHESVRHQVKLIENIQMREPKERLDHLQKVLEQSQSSTSHYRSIAEKCERDEYPDVLTDYFRLQEEVDDLQEKLKKSPCSDNHYRRSIAKKNERANYYCYFANYVERKGKLAIVQEGLEQSESSGNQDRSIAYPLQKVAMAQEKAITARVAGNITVATKWEKVAERYQEVSEWIVRESENNKGLSERGLEVFDDAIDRLFSASFSLEKVITAKELGKKDEAILWDKLAALYQEAAYEYRKVAEGNTNVTKSKDECSREQKEVESKIRTELLNNSTGVAYMLSSTAEALIIASRFANNPTNIADRLSSTACALKNVIIARMLGKEEKAVMWDKVVTLYQEPVYDYKKIEAADRDARWCDSHNVYNDLGGIIWSNVCRRLEEDPLYSRKQQEAYMNGSANKDKRDTTDTAAHDVECKIELTSHALENTTAAKAPDKEEEAIECSQKNLNFDWEADFEDSESED